MDLNLSHPPDAQHAPRHAQDIVRLARAVHGVELDYSPASLGDVDRILGDFREGGSTADDLGETLFAFGCYIGEVLVRHALGIWRNAADTPLASTAGPPIVVELPGGSFANPIHRAFARLTNGDADSIVAYYQLITGSS